MKNQISPLITVAELNEIRTSKALVIVDASSGPDAELNYDLKHLDGALFVDLNTDLAEIEEDVSNGGRHPLPNLEDFTQTLGQLGISPTSHVVVYDRKSGALAAARFWWMLKAIGHEKVQVLNGGFQEAERLNFPINGNFVEKKEANYSQNLAWQLPLSAMAEVEKAAKDPNQLVIDVREAGRYKGEFEPIDLVAGHIPGAINIPFSENLDENGLFLSADQLKRKYQAIIAGKSAQHVTVHCGSGVTACHTLLALAVAGIEIPKLYVGSWSEWSRRGGEIGKGQ